PDRAGPWPPPVAGARRLGRPAARRQSVGVLRAIRYRQGGADVSPRALRPRDRGAQDPRGRPSRPALLPGAPVTSPTERLAPGDKVDQFVVGEPAHTGAQSVLYHV